MNITFDLFFENLEKEKIAELFKNVLPWETFKNLKNLSFRCDS